jgi:16S rRNA (uracil1498-N3)-methyltransferase
MQRFFAEDVSGPEVLLLEEEAHHCMRVLRHKPGDVISLMDGKGHIAQGNIVELGKKEVRVAIQSCTFYPKAPAAMHLAIAPTKNRDRMEWLLEKSIECGLSQISFLYTARSERGKLNLERLQKIALAAMKQSGNPWLCSLHSYPSFQSFIQDAKGLRVQKWVAYVQEDLPHLHRCILPGKDGLLLIGPEGDFTAEEVHLAVASGFQAVSLGKHVLRTETAGLLGVNSFYLRQLE